ncbi:MAG: site-2 protease family protein [Candidatus Cloacimonetes bacterium]|nr:site-2 protease family protein [Candidatus Cloacimonadota bacterium]
MPNIPQLLILAPILLMSLTVHELSHGLAAYWLGDDTARRAGRLTLNPLRHLDIMGLLAFIIFKFGWAKPVPVNPYNFKNFKRDMAITAAAGPLSNFLLATLASLVGRAFGVTYMNLAMGNTSLFGVIIYLVVLYNLALGIFNLIPIPPLDGSKILGAFLPDAEYFRFMRWQRHGMFILIGILLLGRLFNMPIIAAIIMPPLNFMLRLLLA